MAKKAHCKRSASDNVKGAIWWRAFKTTFSTFFPIWADSVVVQQREPHLGRRELEANYTGSLARATWPTFQILKWGKPLSQTPSQSSRGDNGHQILATTLPNEIRNCKKSEIVRIVRIAVVFIGASVGLRKWFCKKILRWVVSLKETDKFNFSIFPRLLIDGHDEGVDKKVNIPSADVPCRYASSHWRRYHLFSWNGHSCSDGQSPILLFLPKDSNIQTARKLCLVL